MNDTMSKRRMICSLLNGYYLNNYLIQYETNSYINELAHKIDFNNSADKVKKLYEHAIHSHDKQTTYLIINDLLGGKQNEQTINH